MDAPLLSINSRETGLPRMRTELRHLSLICVMAGLSACGDRHGRNVFGNPEDDRLITRCMTGGGLTVALYINTAGGAAVGTSWSVTAERKPALAERQVMYSDYKPALTALRCEAQGFVLATSGGSMTFKDVEMDALRATPRNLAEASSLKDR
jgi:hypothetical protein